MLLLNRLLATIVKKNGHKYTIDRGYMNSLHKFLNKKVDYNNEYGDGYREGIKAYFRHKHKESLDYEAGYINAIKDFLKVAEPPVAEKIINKNNAGKFN